MEVAVAALLWRVFPILATLAEAGTQRDWSGKRRVPFIKYAELMLVGLFIPILNSACGMVADSGLKNVCRLTGGCRMSLGLFSVGMSVFDPQLLEGIVGTLRTEVHH